MEKTCGNCNSCDHKAWLCDWEEEDGTHRSVMADTPGCEDWELLRLSDEERLEGLEAATRCVHRALGALMDDETVKAMPMLYLSLTKMRDQLGLALGVM